MFVFFFLSVNKYVEWNEEYERMPRVVHLNGKSSGFFCIVVLICLFSAAKKLRAK